MQAEVRLSAMVARLEAEQSQSDASWRPMFDGNSAASHHPMQRHSCMLQFLADLVVVHHPRWHSLGPGQAPLFSARPLRNPDAMRSFACYDGGFAPAPYAPCQSFDGSVARQIRHCGNHFLVDSLFCRKCGAMRPEPVRLSQVRFDPIVVSRDAPHCPPRKNFGNDGMHILDSAVILARLVGNLDASLTGTSCHDGIRLVRVRLERWS